MGPRPQQENRHPRKHGGPSRVRSARDHGREMGPRLRGDDDEKGETLHSADPLAHGDVVLATAQSVNSKDKIEARVVRVLEPRSEPIVGRYYKDFALGVVVPDAPRITQDIVIPDGEQGEARHGQVVLVEITQRPSKRVNGIGKVTEVLGEHMAPGMEIEIAIRNHQIPHVFSDAVLKQVAKYGEEVPSEAKQGRVDLTQLGLITIDGEDARDFDDAVYAEAKDNGGWRLWVAIADVSASMAPSSLPSRMLALRV